MIRHLTPFGAIAFLAIVLSLGLITSCASSPDEEAAADAPPGVTAPKEETAPEVTVEASFSGLKDVDSDELLAAARREISAFERKGQRLADLADAAYAIERELRARGYPKADVTFDPEAAATPINGKGEKRKIKFTVNQGPLAYMNAVEFARVEGSDEGVPDEVLRTFFPAGDEPIIWRRSQIEGGLNEVETSFLLRGYYKVKVLPLEPRWNEAHSLASPLVSIESGKLWTMEFNPPEGSFPSEVSTLFPESSEIEGKPYHVRQPAALAAKLRKQLSDIGYQEAEVSPDVTLDETRGIATVTLKVKTGLRFYLGDIIVRMNERTKESFIREVFELKPGDLLSQKKLDDTTDRMYRTGIFSRVGLEVAPRENGSDEGDGIADLVVEAEETEARNVDFMLGWGSYELLRGGVSYKDRNLYGSARILDARLQASLRNALFEVGITDPYTLGVDDVIQVRGGAEYREEPSFTISSLNFLASVRHDIDRNNSITAGYRLTWSSVSDVTATEENDVEENSTIKAGLFVDYHHDTRDNPLIPDDGFLIDAGVLWSTPTLLADLNFLELRIRSAHYLKVTDGTVLALGVSAATRHVLDDRDTLPIQERLFAGGETSVRSFQQSELGPSDENGDPLGGLTSAEAHIELRQQIIDNFHIAAFYDVGVVNRESFDFAGPFGHAIGLGLRYYLPIGPARLDFAINPGEKFAADQSWALHFSFGFSF